MTSEQAQQAAAVAFRPASAADIPEIARLVVHGNLPPFFIEEYLSGFEVAERDGELLVTGGVEIYGSSAVLRSIVVAESARGLGLGRVLAERLSNQARQAGCTDLYLFTQDAHAFWQHLGFVDVPLEQWNQEPRACWQYQYIANGVMDTPLGDVTRRLVEGFLSEHPDRAELGEIFSMWKRA